MLSEICHDNYETCKYFLQCCHIAEKFNDILSILKEVVIFPEKGDLFRIGKTYIYEYENMNQNYIFSFVYFFYEGKKLAVYAEEMLTTIYLHVETLKKLVVK